MTLEIGTLLNNRYRITSILGIGGMGAVYQAVDENLGIPVAVKENLFLTNEYARQFQREANILAGLRHPSLPRVGDYFAVANQGQYLVMDYIDGEDLRQRIERLGVLPENDVVIIGAAMCDALSYLHSRKPPIIHRDIKPGNIKITPQGHVALVDFGLAKELELDQRTTTGARAMTPGYSPPEQYGTAPTDSRTDIYSLGATLYASLTSSIPEDGLARATGNAELTPLRSLAPKVNRKLAAVIEKALSVDQDDRYQSADEFRKAMIEASGQSQLAIGPPTVTPPPFLPPLPASDSNSNSSAPEEGGLIKSSMRRNQRSVTRRKKNRLWQPVLGLIAALILLFILLPDFANAVRGLVAKVPLPTQFVNLYPTPSNTAQISINTPTSTLEPTQTVTLEITLTPIPPTEVVESTMTFTPSPSATQTGGGNGQIAFSSNRTGTMQIWLMNIDGSQQRSLTNLPDGACDPTWSPDGKKIAFISPCITRRDFYENTKIFILEIDSGTDAYPLPLPPSPSADYDPAWSPDGTRIAFTSTRAGNPDIYIFNLRDNSLLQATDDRNNEKHPAWSMGSSQIVYTRDAPLSQIWIMSDTGKYQMRFSISGEVNDVWPEWSPDGNYIYFSSMKSDGIPWLMAQRYEDRGTVTSTRIPPRGQPQIGPVAQISISPDGNWILYESWPDGTNHDIYLATINGGGVTRLTTDKDFDFAAAWRPISQP